MNFNLEMFIIEEVYCVYEFLFYVFLYKLMYMEK